MKLKVMTFNIGGFFSDRGENYNWENRSDLCAEIIQNCKPDVLGCQEAQMGNIIFFQKRLMDYNIHLGQPTFSKEREKTMYNPIFWKRNRFKKCESGEFYLSRTPHKWSKSSDSMHVRGATWINLQCLKTDNNFIHLNTHLDHYGEQSRIEGSKLIIDQIAKIRGRNNTPVILTGDFNSRIWAPLDEKLHAYPHPVIQDALPEAGTVYKIYEDNYFRDTYLEAGHSNALDTNTYHDLYGKAFPPVALRIDWILKLNGIQKLLAEKCKIINYAKPPIYPSDHYPVIAEFAWE